MKAKILFLDAALILLVGFFIYNEEVVSDVGLNLKAGRSIEYLSVSGRSAASQEKAHFVKAIFTLFPDAHPAIQSARPVVHPVSLEQVAP
jgi:hypothetical protein